MRKSPYLGIIAERAEDIERGHRRIRRKSHRFPSCHFGVRCETHSLKRELIWLGIPTPVFVEVACQRLHEQIGLCPILEDATGAGVGFTDLVQLSLAQLGDVEQDTVEHEHLSDFDLARVSELEELSGP